MSIIRMDLNLDSRKALFHAVIAAALMQACASPPKPAPEDRPSFWAPEVEGLQPDDQTVGPRRAFRTDSQIRGDFLAAMANDPNVDVFDIRPEVSNGRIILHEVSASPREMTNAESLAKHIAGVRGVKSETHAPEAQSLEEIASEPADIIRTDDQIRRDVIDRLMKDGRVLIYGQRVSIHQGVVTLSGRTDYLHSKRWAAEDARGTHGVKQVINRISIRLTRFRPDDQLKKEIITALGMDPYFDPDAVHVQVTDGVVRLRGEVETPQEREDLIEKISLIRGVTDIRDEVKTRA